MSSSPDATAPAREPSSHPTFPPALIPGIIPGASVNLLAGAPGAGKTTLLAWMLRQFRDGAPIFGRTPATPTKIALICADRSWAQSTSQWFHLVGYPDIAAYSLTDDRELRKARLRDKKQRIDILAEAFDHLQLPWGALCCVDPLALFFGGNILDYDACAVACIEIRHLCQDRGITVIGTAHASKQRGDSKDRYVRLQDRIAGSTALLGFIDTQMYLATPEELDEPFSVFRWSPHHAPQEDFKLVRGPDGLFIPFDGPDMGELTTEAAQLLQAIAIAPEMTKMKDLVEVAAQLGIERRSLYRLLDRLAESHVVVRVSRGYLCRPKPQS